MPIPIKAPNGEIVEFPDGTSEATIEAAMRQTYGMGDQVAPATSYDNGRGISVELLGPDPAQQAATGAQPGPSPQQPATPAAQPAQQAPAAPEGFSPIKDAAVAAVPFVGPFMQQLDHGGVRAFSRGVPVLSGYVDEANAATNAALAPAVEPAMRGLEKLGVPTGYDERFRLDDKGSFGERYDAARQFEKGLNTDAVEANPGMVATGMVGGLVAGLPYLGALSARAAGQGLLTTAAAGALEGGVWGGVQGYGDGQGDAADPSRMKSAALAAALGGGAGAALPMVGKGLAAAWQGGKNAVRSTVTPGAGPAGAEALEGLPERDLAEIMASIKAAPEVRVPAGAEDDAYNRIAMAMVRQKMSADEVVGATRAVGPRGVMADTGEPMRDLLRAAVNRPSGAAEIAKRNLDTRQVGILQDGEYTVRPSSQRVMDDAAEKLGVDGKRYFQEFEDLNQAQREASAPAYDLVRAHGPVSSAKLDDLARRPSVQEGMKRAYKLAREDGKDPEGLGLVNVDNMDDWANTVPPGEQTVRQALEAAARGGGKKPGQGPSLIKYIADGGGMKDPGGELSSLDAQLWNHGKAFQRRVIGDADTADGWAMKAWEAGYFPELAERPTERELLDAISAEMRGTKRFAREADVKASDRARLRDEADEMIYRGGGEDAAGSADDYVGRPEPQLEPAWTTQPTLESWDYVKQGLDDILEGHRDPITGKIKLTPETVRIKNTLQEVRSELVRLTGGQDGVYRQALNAYAGPASLKTAMEAGRKALSVEGEQVGMRMADMGAGEQDAYRLGFMQGLKKIVGGADVTNDAARVAGLLKPNQLERFKEVFPDQATYAAFVNNLGAEQKMFQTRGALGNSTTARQLAHAQDEPNAAGQAVEAVVNVKTGGLASLARIMAKIGGPKPMKENTAEALAAILTSLDQGGLDVAAGRLTEAERRMALGRALGAVGRPATAEAAYRSHGQ